MATTIRGHKPIELDIASNHDHHLLWYGLASSKGDVLHHPLLAARTQPGAANAGLCRFCTSKKGGAFPAVAGNSWRADLEKQTVRQRKDAVLLLRTGGIIAQFETLCATKTIVSRVFENHLLKRKPKASL